MPSECVRIIEGWRDKRKPLRLVVTGSDINYAVTIRDFSYDVQRAGSGGDIYYSLSLKEYRFLDAKKSVAVAEKAKPAAAKAAKRPPVVNKGAAKKATSYTVKSGDTLSKAFGKDWRKVYDANRKVIGANPNKIAVGTKLVIPK
ncbi:LysM peptidoglycan-binding domain-containing protein [Sporosarcina psychrophila]|uniref:LysM repeat protein n=1 Tax=Sporosarcina psychrophila TaxID=1476 RepID=A0ABV2KBR6_SPOPS